MRIPRISIAGLLWLILLCGIGLAAMRSPTLLWNQALYTATVILLLGSIFGVLRRRPFWVGFALFGWGFFLVSQLPTSRTVGGPRLVHWAGFDALYTVIYMEPNGYYLPPTLGCDAGAIPRFIYSSRIQMPLRSVEHYVNFLEIGDSLTCLAVALLGATLAATFNVPSQREGPR